ncbi:UNVERIFIED_CONTAM: Light-harvesting complex-like protein OHP2, chloroplastic [Sesamum indicum]
MMCETAWPSESWSTSGICYRVGSLVLGLPDVALAAQMGAFLSFCYCFLLSILIVVVCVVTIEGAFLRMQYQTKCLNCLFSDMHAKGNHPSFVIVSILALSCDFGQQHALCKGQIIEYLVHILYSDGDIVFFGLQLLLPGGTELSAETRFVAANSSVWLGSEFDLGLRRASYIRASWGAFGHTPLPLTSNSSSAFTLLYFHISEGPLRRLVVPAPGAAVTDKNVITLELQRPSAKELQEYIRQRKLEEADRGPFFGFIAKNEVCCGRNLRRVDSTLVGNNQNIFKLGAGHSSRAFWLSWSFAALCMDEACFQKNRSLNPHFRSA